DIVLAFLAHLAGFLDRFLRAKLFICFVTDGFRPNKSSLKIAVYHPRRLGRSGPFSNGPGASFFWAHRKISDKHELFVGSTNQPFESRALHSELFEKHLFFTFIYLSYLF